MDTSSFCTSVQSILLLLGLAKLEKLSVHAVEIKTAYLHADVKSDVHARMLKKLIPYPLDLPLTSPTTSTRWHSVNQGKESCLWPRLSVPPYGIFPSPSARIQVVCLRHWCPLPLQQGGSRVHPPPCRRHARAELSCQVLEGAKRYFTIHLLSAKLSRSWAFTCLGGKTRRRETPRTSLRGPRLLPLS